MDEEDDLRSQCGEIVRRVLERYGWTLTMPDESFVESVLREVVRRLSAARNRSLEKIIRDATINRYAHIWHAAILAPKTLRQADALEELKSYLYRAAFRMTDGDRDLAQEGVQETLIIAVGKAHQLKDAGSFPYWALKVLRRQMSKHIKKRARRVIDPETGKPIWQPFEILFPDLADESSGTAVDDPERSSELTIGLRALIESAARNCLSHPLQQEPFIQCYLYDKPHHVIAAELEVSLAQLSVLKHRALKKLRNCPALLALLEDLL